jgi:hypothetical protein
LNPPDFLKQKAINAQTIKEAVIIVQMMNEKSTVSKIESSCPIEWGIDRSLCQHCWQELAEENGYCPLCQEILNQFDKSKNTAVTGMLVSGQYAAEIMNSLPNSADVIPVLIGDYEFLVLLPSSQIPMFLTTLEETASYQSNLVNIVFPGRGDMKFADVLAMARFYAKNAQNLDEGFLTKFFFNHSHMRAFDFENFLSFEITRKLFETAAIIKSAFPRDERSVIQDLLKKDRMNRIYELNRFCSMCNAEQKAVLKQIQIEDSDPERVLFLFQLVRYVY